MKKLHRYSDWRKRLSAYLESVHQIEFSYGKMDCCIFAADAVQVMTGQDLMSDYRGKYDNPEDAKKALKSIGSRSLYATMMGLFGKHRRVARYGDVAYLWGEDGPTIGICLGDKSVFIGRDQSCALVEMENRDLRFFRVG